MTRDILVHIGYEENEHGKRGRNLAWVETTQKLSPEAGDLINALGSKFFRNETNEDDREDGYRPDRLPGHLAQQDILKIYRVEHKYWGDANLSTWADEVGEARFEYAWNWLTELVVTAFPKMKGYV